MKKALSLILALVMCLSLCACGGGNNTPTPEAPSAKLTKNEMLDLANPLKREDLKKACSNIPFTKSLIGNVYTFNGIVGSIKEDYAVITFKIRDDEGIYTISSDLMVANIYLSLEELLAIQSSQELSLIGRLDNVSTFEEDGVSGTTTVQEMVFESASIVSDRFETTGTLYSKNKSFGNNSWNIYIPSSEVMPLVSFADDVSAYKGQKITYSYKLINGECVDAYIVE